MVGPNFKHPAPPITSKYIQDAPVKKTVSIPEAKASGKAQSFQLGKDIPAQWWHIFHSKELNTLILAGLNNSPNLAQATSALNQAKALYAAQIGTLFPTINGSFSAERQRFSLTQFGGSSTGPVGSQTFNLFIANINMAYTLDVFGKLRRQIEAAGAQVDYQQFVLEAAYLTLTSNIASTAIAIASIEEQISVTNALIKAQEQTLKVIKNQLKLGGASTADVLLQESQLNQTRALLPPFKQNLAQNKHALSVLVGELPKEKSMPTLNLNTLNLPQDLPLSCPSLLTRQRPDIRAAEALLHNASALIGVATANMFPQINLAGNYGQQSTVLNALFFPPNNIWSISGAVAQPIFNGGSLIAQRKAAIAAYEQSAAQYKQTVLTAFQNVADVLRALENDAELMKAFKAAETASGKSLHILQGQYKLGGVSYLNLLTAERTYLDTKLARVQAQSARYLDTVALFQSLGGGWWNRCLDNCNPLLTQNSKQYKPEVFGVN
jgi:NodT family efflux transporter outer membrane factor (OMF) lipoprotein